MRPSGPKPTKGAEVLRRLTALYREEDLYVVKWTDEDFGITPALLTIYHPVSHQAVDFVSTGQHIAVYFTKYLLDYGMSQRRFHISMALPQSKTSRLPFDFERNNRPDPYAQYGIPYNRKDPQKVAEAAQHIIESCVEAHFKQTLGSGSACDACPHQLHCTALPKGD